MSVNIDIAARMFAAHGFLPSGKPDRSTVSAGIAGAYINNAGMTIGLGRANIAIISKHIGANIFSDEHCFADLTLRNADTGTYYEFRNGILTDAVSGVLAPPPMLSFKREKNIITTRIDGSDAVIVESFGAKEWDITLDGILVDMQHHTYPANEMRQLREMFEANTTFEVWDCDILADLGIEQIYFDKLEDLKVLEDYPDTVKFALKAKSIKPLEFFM